MKFALLTQHTLDMFVNMECVCGWLAATLIAGQLVDTADRLTRKLSCQLATLPHSQIRRLDVAKNDASNILSRSSGADGTAR